MFREAILPSLRREIGHMKYSLFHLDGPGALKHLDALLELDELDAVQWVYGAGAGPAARWLDVYRRIQDAGKGLQIVGYGGLDEFRAVAPYRPFSPGRGGGVPSLDKRLGGRRLTRIGDLNHEDPFFLLAT